MAGLGIGDSNHAGAVQALPKQGRCLAAAPAGDAFSNFENWSAPRQIVATVSQNASYLYFHSQHET